MSRNSHNRLVSFVRSVVDGLFQDAEYLYTKACENKRDKLRLLSQLDSRGVHVLLESLPTVAKHFDRCLDEGAYTATGGFLSKPKRNGEVVPVFLRELFLRIFHHDGRILDDPCVGSILFIRTLLTTWKTLRLPCSKEAVENEVQNFFSLDASLRAPNLRWDCDDLGSEGIDSFELECRSLHVRDLAPSCDGLFESEDALSSEESEHIQRCFDIVASSIGLAPHLCGDQSNASHRPRNGPGVVAELSARDSKYEFRAWPRKLQRLFPRDEYALPSFGWGFSRDRDPVRLDAHEHPSRLIAVPKTLTKPRLIAAEPSYHQWIQQYLWQVLEERVQRTALHNSIRFRDQKWNRKWALEGSIAGKYSTIDLSEASDRLTCAVVERFFRRNPGWIEALHASRTRWLSYRGERANRYTVLRKFSTMGSTVIFPLQSIIYATVSIAASLWTKREKPTFASIRRHSLKVRTFGDDIIVERESLAYAIRFIEALGLKVNQAKTFSGFNFRESCGMDAFRGVCVTPPRLRGLPGGTPASVAPLVETSNNFHKKGFWYTAMYIRRHLERWVHLIPIGAMSQADVNDDGWRPTGVLAHGFLSFTGSSTSHLRSRWNEDWQREEYRILRTHLKEVEGPMSPRARLLQYFTEDPDPHTKWKSGFALSRTTINRPGWAAL